MKLSTDRILTTHVGSLPRSQAVSELLMAREAGTPHDPAAFDAAMAAHVDEVVARQVKAGVDVVSDGETSKISYATYIKDRLSGFGGDNERQIAVDLQPYPEFRARMAVFAGRQSFKRESCIGPIAVIEHESLRKDIANLEAAAQRHGPRDVFMNAASPGVVAAFQPNRYYPSHEAYIEAIATAMRQEYEAIVAAGITLQVDCPDLAMAHHTGFQDLSEEQFIRRTHQHVEALNEALRNIPAAAVRMHVCWGNYEGPHDHDIDLVKVLPAVLKAKPAAILFEAANPRHAHEWAVWQEAKLPADKVLVPGLLTSTSNYVEHPDLIAQKIVQFAGFVGRERVIAGTDCGFGTFAGIGKMDPGISYAKLASLAEGARRASRQLWG
ncbi:MAG TPA: cobalamin-independent methionine synthase II family protein [Steroidobacteraceae bacterium]|nr:cobalamin-independent methionine synthase II family protein [Steroidobacteraceae bacterium]